MKTKAFAFLSILMARPAIAAESDKAVEILKLSLAPAKVCYSGRMIVTHWYGDNSRTDDIKVWYKPPNRYRWEFLNPDGSTARAVVSDGVTEQTLLVEKRKVLKGCATKCTSGLASNSREWELLNRNYEITLRAREPIAGRVAWLVELTPRMEGKPRESIWIDEKTGVILAVKRYREGGNLAAHSRYVRFDPMSDVEGNFFAFKATATAETINHRYDMDAARATVPVTAARHLPEKLPFGFIYEGSNFFTTDGHRVDHYRFTDGLAQLSIFETSRPARLSKRSVNNASYQPGSIQVHDVGNVLQKKRGDLYITLISDVSTDEIETMYNAIIERQ